MVELGDKVRDKVTGFSGIAVCRHSYLSGCDRIDVQPALPEDTTPTVGVSYNEHLKLPDIACFDEPQLEVLEAGVVAPYQQDENLPGGPKDHNSIPRR